MNKSRANFYMGKLPSFHVSLLYHSLHFQALAFLMAYLVISLSLQTHFPFREIHFLQSP